MIKTLVRRPVAVDPKLIALHSKLFGDDDRYRKRPDDALMPRSHLAGWPAGSFTRSSRRWTF